MIKINNIIEYIKIFSIKNNIDIFIVGGYIRDILLNPLGEPNDLDLIVDGDMNKIINLFKQNDFYIFPIKKDLNIYRFQKQNICIDLSKLKGKNINEDLMQRDFTINAIALNLRTGKIYDPFNGRMDLKNKVIRQVNENSIKNDKIRILRAMKILIKNNNYRMKISKETEISIRNESTNLKYATKELVLREFMNIIYYDKLGIAFETLDTYGILENIIPYVKEHKNIGKCKYHTESAFLHMNTVYKVFKKFCSQNCKSMNFKNLNINLNEKIGDVYVMDYLAFAAFNHDIGKFECYKNENGKISFKLHEINGAKLMDNFCSYWNFPKKAKKLIVNVVRGHMYPLMIYNSNIKNYKKTLYEFFSKFYDSIPYILIISFCDIYATNVFNKIVNEVETYKDFIQNILNEYNIYKNIKNTKLIDGYEIKEKFQIQDNEIGNVILEIKKMRYINKIQTKKEVEDILKQKFARK